MTEHNFDQLDQLASDFWQWRAFHQPNSSDDLPRIERPRGWEPDWSQEWEIVGSTGFSRKGLVAEAFRLRPVLQIIS
jgi:hypothetical protein